MLLGSTNRSSESNLFNSGVDFDVYRQAEGDGQCNSGRRGFGGKQECRSK